MPLPYSTNCNIHQMMSPVATEVDRQQKVKFSSVTLRSPSYFNSASLSALEEETEGRWENRIHYRPRVKRRLTKRKSRTDRRFTYRRRPESRSDRWPWSLIFVSLSDFLFRVCLCACVCVCVSVGVEGVLMDGVFAGVRYSAIGAPLRRPVRQTATAARPSGTSRKSSRLIFRVERERENIYRLISIGEKKSSVWWSQSDGSCAPPRTDNAAGRLGRLFPQKALWRYVSMPIFSKRLVDAIEIKAGSD